MVVADDPRVIVAGASLPNVCDCVELKEHFTAAMLAAKEIGDVAHLASEEAAAIEKGLISVADGGDTCETY